MSIKLISQVWKPAGDGGSPYTGRKLLLHLALADFADDGGVCWPSQDTLAKKCRMSPRWVSETVIEMASDGYLVRIKRGGKNVGSAKYRLKFPQSQPEVNTPGALVNLQPAVDQPAVSDSSTGTECVQPISNHQDPSLLEALRKEFPSATKTHAQVLADHGVALIEIPLIVQSMRDTYSKPQFVTLNPFMKHFPSYRPDSATLIRAQRQEALDGLDLDTEMYERVKHRVLDLGQDPVQAVSMAETLAKSSAEREERNASRTVEGWKSYLLELSCGQGMSSEDIDRWRSTLSYRNLLTALDEIQREHKPIRGRYLGSESDMS